MPDERAYGDPKIRCYTVDEILVELDRELRDSIETDLENTANLYAAAIEYINETLEAGRK